MTAACRAATLLLRRVHCQLAGVFAVPADVTNVVSHFEMLAGQVAVPPLMAQEVMHPFKDRDFPKHFLLLQDVSAGGDEKRCGWGG